MMRPTRANKPNGYLLGSYRIATDPEPNSSRLTSLKSTYFDSPANNVRMRRQKIANQLTLVRRQIVQNDVDLPRRRPFDHLCEELHKLLAGVAGGGSAEYFAGLRIQRRIQRQRAVTVVFKPVTLGAARGKRQYRIEPVECLNRRLFIHAEHCRVLRRLSIRNPDRRWPGNARSDAVSGPLLSTPGAPHLC